MTFEEWVHSRGAAVTRFARLLKGGGIDTAALVIAAQRRGATLRRRRLAFAAAGVVALAVTAATGAVTVRASGVPFGDATPAPTESLGPPGPATPPPGGWRVPALPVAAGIAGAAARPDQVATDPSLLHFTLDGLVTSAPNVSWRSGGGLESVTVYGADERPVTVTLARDQRALESDRGERRPDAGTPRTSQVTVAGRPATLVHEVMADGSPWWATLTWQPVAGLWARVDGPMPDPGEALTVAAKLRLDRAYRCVAPIRLTGIPATHAFSRCELSLSGAPNRVGGSGVPTRFGRAVLTIGDVVVTVTHRSPESTTTNTWVAGRPAIEYRPPAAAPRIVVPDFDGLRVEVWSRSDFSGAVAADVAAGVVVSADHESPGTWPQWPTPHR